MSYICKDSLMCKFYSLHPDLDVDFVKRLDNLFVKFYKAAPVQLTFDFV